MIELDEWRWSDLKYPFGRPEDHTLTTRELKALHNIIKLAKERLWLLENKDNMRAAYSSEFDEHMSTEQVTASEESIKVCEMTFIEQTEYNQ